MNLLNWVLIGLNIATLSLLAWVIYYVYCKYEEPRDKKRKKVCL